MKNLKSRHIVIDARPINSSGYGRYLQNLIKNLGQLDNQTRYTILVWPDYDPTELDLPDNYNFLTADYPITGSLKEQVNLAWRLYKLKPDLVHFALIQQPVFFFGKSVTTIHDLTTARFHNPAKNWLVFKLKQPVYKFVIWWVAHKSKKIITPSEFVKKDLAKFAHINPRKINVIYEAADKITVPAEKIKNLDGKKFIMYVGRSTPHKNLPRLIDAFNIVRHEHPDLLLVLAGKLDANYRHLQELADHSHLKGGVIFTDYVSEAELRWLYENAAAYVFPSLSEGFGLPGLEAMQYGLPVVSSNATCLPEVYGDAALFFDSTNVSDMAQKISQVIDEPDLAKTLAKKGEAKAAGYSWEKMAQQTLDIYKSLLG